MRTWKLITPNQTDIDILFATNFNKIYLSSSNNPMFENIYFRGNENKLIQMGWSYGDICNSFEAYFIKFDEIEENKVPFLEQIGEISKHVGIKIILRTEWLRPVTSEEVNIKYNNKLISGSGAFSEVPDVAVSIGTSLYGVAFFGEDNQIHTAITVDDENRYCLKIVTERDEIRKILRNNDYFLLSDTVYEWLENQIFIKNQLIK